MNTVEIPLKLTGIAEIKAELKAVKGAIANATDPETMQALAERAGELADKLKDVNEQVSVFNTGSKFEAVSNSFGLIKADLASLDFEGANEKAQVFAKTLGSVGKAEISGALKGLTGVVKTVGGAFVKLGAQILANPIFLLAAVITAVVVAVGVFLNKIGVLDKALKVLMTPINAIIAGFKKLTDYMGLTNYAAEENAAKMGKANEKAAASSQKRSEIIADGYDIEIAKAKAAGKDTAALEIAKSKALSKEAAKRLSDQRKEYAALQKIASKDNLERRKKLREQIEAENKILRQGRKERQLIEIDSNAKKESKEKETASKGTDNAKNYAKNRLDAERSIKDIEIALIADDNERELATLNEKYRRLIEDVKKNENLTGKEKVELTKLYESQKQAELDKSAKTQLDAETKRQEQIAQKIKDNENAQLLRQEEFEEQLRQLQMTDTEREIDAVQTKYFELIALAEQYGLDTKVLEEKRAAEIKAINDKVAADTKAKALAEIETAKQVRDAKISTVSDYANVFSNLATLVTKDQKKLEKINKASALVQIGIDTAKAISSLVAASQSNALNGVTGGLAGVAQFASGILQITTNMVKAKQLLSNPSGSVSGGGGGGSSPSGSSTSVSPLTPAVQMFGQGNQLNTVGQPQSVTAQQNITVQAIVSESDITNTQNKIDKIKKGSEL
jgi:hypothetical protein